MVSNEEITQRLRNKREGKSLNGYLVCNNCGGYYELQPGESWKILKIGDFGTPETKHSKIVDFRCVKIENFDSFREF